MIDLADPAKATHSFVPAPAQWEMFTQQRLLGAVLLRAIEDIRHGDPRDLTGMACGCPADVPCAGNKCPHPIPYEIMGAAQWVIEMSEMEWGFGWVCRKLGRDPLRAAMAILVPHAPQLADTLYRSSLSRHGQGVILGVGD